MQGVSHIMLFLMPWAILSNFYLKLNQIQSELRCYSTSSLFIIRNSINKSSAPAACCGHVMAAWQRRMAWSIIFRRQSWASFIIASSWPFPSMAGIPHWPVADQPQRKKLPLRWLPGNYLALWLKQGKIVFVHWLTVNLKHHFSYTSILNH